MLLIPNFPRQTFLIIHVITGITYVMHNGTYFWDQALLMKKLKFIFFNNSIYSTTKIYVKTKIRMYVNIYTEISIY